jgi:cob(I)alamin adenosyltransferase
MVTLNRIYTRTGDGGQTALGDGTRVAKHSLRVDAYGTVDEVNAAVGIARLFSTGAMDDALARIQNDLFDLGADLCRPAAPADAEKPPLRVTPGQATRLEGEMDQMLAGLQPLRSFVLPGGVPMAAQFHVCRTVTRRAERLIAALAEAEPINPAALTYANRLSDWFFVAARAVNAEAQGDLLWEPGQNR